jgi:hypothetical protein
MQREIEDRIEIVAVLDRYAEALDQRRTPAGWRSVMRRAQVFFELGSREVLGPALGSG